MAYTPINWQTGDTITAEKLNRCDNGWSAGAAAEIFSETVTTAESEFGNEGPIPYVGVVSAPEITVEFGNVEYTCQRVDVIQDTVGYGGVLAGWEYDFTDYPFALIFSESNGNVVATETAGTYTVTVSAASVEVSDGFSAAVNACIDAPALGGAVLCVPGVTNMADVQGAALPFFYEPNDTSRLHIITVLGSPSAILPESSSISAGFGRDDGLFYCDYI